ncbi:uncharacterized protein ACLA_019360 [Aspergillus clavatus NRRL 1]|uniref:Uncharacterized protein n=1 Tax=Aspergillus clavatus (strain ATCC 1007 / CBS 513.65 / DSM 816 / NCTC 3887 / NRRL 1 / QM 1276 / 107) TaxID=344612 RepID=A1CNL0_ASPCL|nr:uncharacterized protein ACLA_019360 [Aspergillus clavatus NRRL 1]EAW07231.1 conserved hypothetical protein [Aspergillus clavatus NRRL 1]
MSTGSTHLPDSSTLGESWVVASASSLPRKDLPEKPCRKDRANEEDDHKGCASMTTSASSISGPELIMPSICEVSVSEGSWVAPEIRSRSPTTVRRRHKRQSTSKQHADAPNTHGSQTRKPAINENDTATAHTTRRSSRITRYIRTMLNLLLMAAIAHLLILPEFVTQYQTLCSIQALSSLYPSSCIPPYPQPPSEAQTQPQPHQSPTQPATLNPQTRLETLFNTTLHQLNPLHPTVRQTEPLLQTLHSDLKNSYPGAKHELDLEFYGCSHAARAAAAKFASLKADLQSAMDSLRASASQPPLKDEAGAARSVARDARLSTQLARREQYLDQLTARMQAKAEALGNDFAALDDHLESIQRIARRERHVAAAAGPLAHRDGNSNKNGDANANSNSNGLWALVDAFVPSLSLRGQDKGSSETGGADEHAHVSESLRQAVAHHQPVAGVIQGLYRDLESLQSRKGRF